jgi:hypothetical protein
VESVASGFFTGNISAKFVKTVFNCFNQPYFQPDFSNKTTLVANDSYTKQTLLTLFCTIGRHVFLFYYLGRNME